MLLIVKWRINKMNKKQLTTILITTLLITSSTTNAAIEPLWIKITNNPIYSYNTNQNNIGELEAQKTINGFEYWGRIESGENARIHYLTSDRTGTNLINHGAVYGNSTHTAERPYILRLNNGTTWMFYKCIQDKSIWRVTWNNNNHTFRNDAIQVLKPSPINQGKFDDSELENSAWFFNEKTQTYNCIYEAKNVTGQRFQMGYAYGKDITNLTKYFYNPIFHGDQQEGITWRYDAGNPCFVQYGNYIIMFFGGLAPIPPFGAWRIGIAVTQDFIHWTEYNNMLFNTTQSWEIAEYNSIADPTVLIINNKVYLWYGGAQSSYGLTISSVTIYQLFKTYFPHLDLPKQNNINNILKFC